MLPARSKRYAGSDGEVPRLRLATNWQLAIVAIIMAGLLVLIFPQKALIEKLYDQEQLDELTLSYIENLRRTDPGNADLAILLGRAQGNRLDLEAVERLTQPVVVTGDPRQRAEARMLLVTAYERALDEHPTNPALQKRLRELVDGALQDAVPSRLAGAFAAVAFRLEMPAAGMNFLRRIEGGYTPDILVRYAREALGSGRHTLAAEYFLLARQQTADRQEARALFREGIETLMAASRFKQAMKAADRYVGDLSTDPDTLRFLARTALAAGEPARAASYARALVFLPSAPARKGQQ